MIMAQCLEVRYNMGKYWNYKISFEKRVRISFDIDNIFNGGGFSMTRQNL